MTTIVKPQVLVFQEFETVPSEITEPLRAHISGPNAELHRYSDATEKAGINLGAYDPINGACYLWPGRVPGSLVDEDYVSLFIDDAKLLYFADLVGDLTDGRGVNTAVADHANWLRSSSVAFKSNGIAYPRSTTLLGDRDVRVGDLVYVHGIGGACAEYELWTEVAGFAGDEVASSIGLCAPADTNADTTTESGAITQIGGAVNCIVAVADTSGYSGLASGDICETYTIEVIQGSVQGCATAKIRVTSASGRDDVAEADVAALGLPTDIGTRGLTVTFDEHAASESCSSAAEYAGYDPDDFIVGQRWSIPVCQDFERACCNSGGAYTGAEDDTYIVEVTKGGLFADLPEVTVTTVKGLDFSGPTTVTAVNTDIVIGTKGATFQVADCFGSVSSSASFYGDDDLAWGLRKGDKFYVPVVAAISGSIQTLILRHDLPTELLAALDMDLKLYIESDIEVSANRLSEPPLTNYDIEATQICVQDGITAYDASVTLNGVEQPLTVEGGTLFAQYREWLVDLADEVNFISDIADIGDIPGPLDEDNPLKWGVYRALQNSAASGASGQAYSTRVGYTAVADPDSLDSWQLVLERIDGRNDLYNLVPLTFDREVLGLYQAHVSNESTPEAGNWKAMFAALLGQSSQMLVGQSSADTQALHPTSTDGNVVLATVADNPNATETQYTLLSVPAGNAGFVTYGVAAGDIVRFLYTVDAWSDASYQEFVVDQVLSEDTLLLMDGLSAAITVAQKVEIWHTLEKNEILADLKDQAQSFADRRVCAVWPDLVGTDGNTQYGYFLCAGLAGLVGSVVPHQPLTNIEIKGFDDYSRSYQFFSDSQIDLLDDSGVWICTEDRDGTPHTRHALTTDTTDTNRQEEMIRRNVDAISYLFLNRLRPYIGRTNVTPTMLDKLRSEIERGILFLKANAFTAELGGQLIEGSIRSLDVHPLLADRVVVVLDLTVPAPLNQIELHLVV